jgi:hypothetical protein
MKRLCLLLGLSSLFLFACEESSSPQDPTPPVGTINTPPPGTPPTTPPATTNECAKPTAGPTEHVGSIGTETWTANGSPHILKGSSPVTGTLTIEPCAEVLIAGGMTITIGAGGKVVAEGLATKPIHIGAEDAAKPFAQIRAINGGTLRLAYATVDGGGDPLNSIPDGTGTLFAQGSDQNAPTQGTIFVDHVTVRGSKSNGLTLMDGAGFAPGSQDLTVTGAAQYPMSIWARAVGTVPTGQYTGNSTDEIVMPGNGGAEAIHEDATMFNRGVPYRAGNTTSAGGLTIERQSPSSAGLATLTIEAGVKIRVKKGAVIRVQRFTGETAAQGALVVNGTAAQPVIFTSAEATPAAGDWLGIWYGLTPAPNNKMDHARIEFAGGTSSSGSEACNSPGTNDAAIRIFGLPSSAFITNTTIVNSAGHGIDRGWSDDTKPDFLTSNTFTSVAGCRQSYPRDTNGACPSVVPCPN